MELAYNILYLVFLSLLVVLAFAFVKLGDRLGVGKISYFDYDKMKKEDK